jgi:hypothetical protein
MKGEFSKESVLQTAPTTKAKSSLPRQTQWKLVEMVHVATELSEGLGSVPLQLLKWNGAHQEAASNAVFVFSGYQGSGRGDSHLSQLFQRAITRSLFKPEVDVYVVPVVNPMPQSRKINFNLDGIDISQDFPSSAALAEAGRSLEARTLMRWIETTRPKALLSFSVGPSIVRFNNVAPDLIEKIQRFSEKEAFTVGEEPVTLDQNGNSLGREDLSLSLGQWASEQGLHWLDFRVDALKKSFDEVKDSDWKSSFGPAAKWLIEGLRFSPELEEPAFQLPEVIPTLDLPPEFANL